MHIRVRSRGTNQHRVKGELVGAEWCKKHGIWDSTPIVKEGDFLIKKRVDTCPECEEDSHPTTSKEATTEREL